MKKLISVAIVMACLFLFCSCAFIGYLFEEKSLKEAVSEHLSISLEDATVLEEWDNHGGFHGDGETFVKLSCADGFEVNFGSEWKETPLDDKAYQFFNDYMYEGVGFCIHPETGEKVIIPEVENGYWYYKKRGWANWDFALYDSDKNILYYYQLDM